jgi:hypothetical protein
MTRTGWNRLSVAIGAGGVAAAVLAMTPAIAVPGRTAVPGATTGVKIFSATHSATVVLKHPPSTTLIVKLTVPAGKWALSAKLWGDSVASTTNPTTVVRCALLHGGKFLDVSVFNTPRVSGTSAGVIYLGAVATFTSKATVVMDCDDIGSNAQVHNAELTAIGP